MIELCLGTPTWQCRYEPEDLCDADRARLPVARAPRAERDWRVSRAAGSALRRAAGAGRNAPLALSHSNGHALVALAPAGWALGVDLERCRSRDVDALAGWVCTAEERRALMAHADAAARLQYFYVLWTLKESLLKAAGLAFPAGMAQVGLAQAGTPAAVLRAPQGHWQAMAWRLPQDWVAAAAWRPEPGTADAHIDADAVHWLQPAPPLQLLGHWRTPSP